MIVTTAVSTALTIEVYVTPHVVAVPDQQALIVYPVLTMLVVKKTEPVSATTAGLVTIVHYTRELVILSVPFSVEMMIVSRAHNSVSAALPTLTEEAMNVQKTSSAHVTTAGQELTVPLTQEPVILAVSLATDHTTLTVMNATNCTPCNLAMSAYVKMTGVEKTVVSGRETVMHTV